MKDPRSDPTTPKVTDMPVVGRIRQYHYYGSR
jgi:hypothetical protein